MAELDGVLSKEIVEHGLREFPNECCGLIAAADGVPTKVFTMTNADASPVTYRLDGKEQLRVFDQMDDAGPRACGRSITPTRTRRPTRARPTGAHYPDGSPIYPDVRYVLLSLADRAKPVLRSFLIRRRRGHRRGADDHMSDAQRDVHRGAGPAVRAPHHPAQHRRSGQRKLLDASVLVIGAGGLGSPIAMYLAAAGIGKLGIVDFDRVDVSNLQRQILHTDADVGRPKVESAVEHLRAINPTIEIVGHDTLLFSTNVYDVFDGYDVIVDGTDNFPVRYLVNDATPVHGQAARLRLDLPVRGAGDGVHAGPGDAVLPLPVPVAAAARHGAELRRGRRVRRAARRDRLDPGDRGDQADHRRGRDRSRAGCCCTTPCTWTSRK